MIGKLAALCCDAKSSPDVVASCRSRLRSSLIARFADVEFLPHAATTTADNPTANIEDLRTVRTVASKAIAYARTWQWVWLHVERRALL